ncbi:uncharacterized protein PHALS_10076 [Plasmopara halstedii]|uniref:Uncharacterized protein n=1 Tax=Plasmopara halstedii TaxID=4781 RepID=A0A0N7L4W9_PLAHL|nr:uncharacterized protein PHALS_10076 [Plasmopara halstedii]CEG39843.1 hypothetical protein PHALS_10076 [Plasmopara halstedii]|eukprot:XP_024576212.1 hypothetical protein PHALS_10076 [Plasmopara halstedii]
MHDRDPNKDVCENLHVAGSSASKNFVINIVRLVLKSIASSSVSGGTSRVADNNSLAKDS